jgi:hypothetical protein
VAALAIALAPTAQEVCQAECASHVVTTAPAAHHHGDQAAAATASDPAAHSCHRAASSAPQPERATLEGIPHACGHSDHLPVSSSTVLKAALAAPAVVLVAFEFPPAPARPHWATEVASSPPVSRKTFIDRLRI